MDPHMGFQIAKLVKLLHAQSYRADQDFRVVLRVLDPFDVS